MHLFLIMLNKLKCHAYFPLSAIQFACCRLLTNTNLILNGSADSNQLASQKPTDLELHCLQRQGVHCICVQQDLG